MQDIKQIRGALGLSQAELAARLGISQGTVSRFENGDIIPNARTMLAMQALLAGVGGKAA